MAGTGHKLWATGDLVQASAFNTYLQDQVIGVYADSSARDAAFGGSGEPTLAEGMCAFLKDTNEFQIYSGSGWVSLLDLDTWSVSSGSYTILGDLTVGVDDEGGHVTFYGDTAGDYWKFEDAGYSINKNTYHIIQNDDGYPKLELQAYNDTEATGGLLRFYKADGTAASPTAVDDTATLGYIQWFGYQAGGAFSEGARIQALVSGTPGDNDMPTELRFSTTPDGSETVVTHLQIMPTGQVFIHDDHDLTDISSANRGTLTLNNLDYDSGDYTAIDFTYGSLGSESAPVARIAARITGSGSELRFGTSQDYSAGITNEAMIIDKDGRVKIYGEALVEDDASTFLYLINEAGGDSYFYMSDDEDTDAGGLVYNENDHLFLRTASSYKWYVTSAGVFRPYGSSDYVLQLSNAGSGDTTPSTALGLQFLDDTDTGIYLYSTGNLAFSTAGTRRAQMSSAGFYTVMGAGSGYYVKRNTTTGYLEYITSSIKYKENVEDMPKEKWEKVYDLVPRKFDWKDNIDHPVWGATDYGFIAEEVNEVIPELVEWGIPDPNDEDAEVEIISVDYGKVTPYLIEAIKDLKSRIEGLENP